MFGLAVVMRFDVRVRIDMQPIVFGFILARCREDLPVGARSGSLGHHRPRLSRATRAASAPQMTARVARSWALLTGCPRPQRRCLQEATQCFETARAPACLLLMPIYQAFEVHQAIEPMCFTDGPTVAIVEAIEAGSGVAAANITAVAAGDRIGGFFDDHGQSFLAIERVAFAVIESLAMLFDVAVELMRGAHPVRIERD